jgi:photosystem II stability/assembly factor-like uncharacterized protein
LPPSLTEGEEMRSQDNIILLIVTVVLVAVSFSTGGSRGNLYAIDRGGNTGVPGDPVIDLGGTTGSPGDPVVDLGGGTGADTGVYKAPEANFDKDFLKKNTIAPSKTGFRDRLDVPAKMSLLAATNLLNGIASAGSRVVAVGVRGHIVYSEDKGKTWHQSQVPLSVDLTSVSFPTAKEGWAVGHDGVILHSADGGTTWKKQLDGYDACRIMNNYYREHPVSGNPNAEKIMMDIKSMIEQGPVNPFLDVWFENETTGFAVGAFNLIFRTEDGGKSWIPWFDRTENPKGLHLYCIAPVGKDIFISGEQGTMLKLDSKAKRFRALTTPYTGTFFGIVGKPGVIVAYGMLGNVYRSTNGGIIWEKINAGVGSSIFGGTLGKDGSIILVTMSGNVIVSKDNGKTFTEVKREGGLGIPANAVTLVDDKTLVIAGWLGAQVQKIK